MKHGDVEQGCNMQVRCSSKWATGAGDRYVLYQSPINTSHDYIISSDAKR